ncbi:acylphosphatase [bacterium]|nr:acylphosphatase [bacterium]MCP5462973.1 acylphosphatase [bacterium]
MKNECQLACLMMHFLGRVQGVGFRYSVRSIAQDFQVAGYVKNLKNGSVEVCAEGEERDLIAFRSAIGKSRLAPYIVDIYEEWLPYKGIFTAFAIDY